MKFKLYLWRAKEELQGFADAEEPDAVAVTPVRYDIPEIQAGPRRLRRLRHPQDRRALVVGSHLGAPMTPRPSKDRGQQRSVGPKAAVIRAEEPTPNEAVRDKFDSANCAIVRRSWDEYI